MGTGAQRRSRAHKVGLCSFCRPRSGEQPGRSSRAFLGDLGFLPLILSPFLTPEEKERDILRAELANFLGRQTTDPDAKLSESQMG